MSGPKSFGAIINLIASHNEDECSQVAESSFWFGCVVGGVVVFAVLAIVGVLQRILDRGIVIQLRPNQARDEGLPEYAMELIPAITVNHNQ